MTQYLDYTFNDSPEFVDTFDELPLWSASFGLLLLKHVPLKPNQTVVDVGSGAGFPLMELAGRLGPSCRLYGVDPWVNANRRARQKIRNYGLSNVEIIEGSAEKMPFDNNFADLVVSNLGINNFSQPAQVFTECNRILKPCGKLILTTNINGHWKEFYRIFGDTLVQLGRQELVSAINADQAHRGTIESLKELFINGGFAVTRYYQESFDMRFMDGSAFLNHYFVKLGWLSSWRDLLPPDGIKEIFMALEKNLNTYAGQSGGLTLTVPMVLMEGEKPL
jgi:arsenite methyltransferase